MKINFSKSKLVLRFSFNFIFHQFLLFIFLSIPPVLYFYVFKMAPNASNYNILAWITLALYVIYCIFYGYYVAYPMIDIISKIQTLARGEFLKPMSKRKFSPFSSRLYREIYSTLMSLSENLWETKKQRQEFEKMRTEWAAGITHDLKTPLSYIKGYSEMLLSDDYSWTEAGKNNFLQIMQQNAIHLDELIKDLGMAFHMDEMESLPTSMKPIHLTELLRQCVAEVINMPQSQNSFFDWIGTNDDIQIMGDYKLLQRALINIFTNAIVHNSAPVHIKIQLTEQIDNVFLMIKDDGQGIDKNTLTHLFDRYYRGTSTDKNTSATGLGMAITKQIIEAHHGTIQVKSVINEFTQFDIVLHKNFSQR